MRKTFFLIAFLLSLLLVNYVQSASPAASDDFSEFDEFDEPEIKIENPELNKVDTSPKPPEEEFNDDSPPTETRTDASNDEDEEVTVEEELQPEEDELPEKKEKKPFEPIKLSSLPLHLRFV